MDLSVWAAFAAACFAVLVIPGPTILLVCAYAAARGRAVAAATAIGVALGDLVAMTASLLGLGALLLASATLFEVLRWVGVAYLVYLGVRMAMTKPAPETDAPQDLRGEGWRIGAHAFAVTATNPKGILFFVAFCPQFLDHSQPLGPQFAVMIATFVTMAALNSLAYAALAERAARRLSGAGVKLWINRLGGGALIAMGVLAALARRPG